MRKFSRFLIVFVLALALLEVLLRLAGHIYVRNIVASNTAARPTDTTILCLGESTTVGLWVDWEDSYPKQLEKMLRKHYQRENLNVIVPVHIGQNSSQIANRTTQYLDMYNPALVIMMIGANNLWSLEESHAIHFFELYSKRTILFSALMLLNESRTFKLARYLYLRVTTKRTVDYWGPIGTAWPPQDWVYGVADANPNAFKLMWAYDARLVISESQKRGISVLMMTYPIHPRNYVPVDLMQLVSSEKAVSLVRNDESFSKLNNRGILNEYLMHDRWHPNGMGYRIVAENAFKVIVEEDLLKTRTSRGNAKAATPLPSKESTPER
jgi:lysophospholipase L1-like esterase